MTIEQIRPRMKQAALALGCAALLASPAIAMNAPENRDPQFDKAMRAAVRQYPELLEGPARAGYYALNVVARADGTFKTGSLLFLGVPPGVPTIQDMAPGTPATGAAMRAPDISMTIEGPARARILKEQQIANVGKAANDISVTWYVLPEDFDESRDVQRVADAVRALYTSPMRPTRNPQDPAGAAMEINLLTVFMTEDGLIARQAMEPISTAAVQALNPRPLNTAYFGASAFTPPPVPVEAFKVLGLEAGEIGQTGLVMVEPERSNPDLSGAPLSAQRQQVQQLLRQIQTGPAVLVRYAWPRRPGEPVGGKAPASASP